MRKKEEMNKITSAFGWTIEYDREGTIQALSAVEHSGAESCGCQDCRNWISARQEAFPEPVNILFHELGIRADRESEIGIPLDTAKGTLLYSSFYHFIGKIVEGPDILQVVHKIRPHGDFGKGTVSEMKLHCVNQRCSVGFQSRRDLLPTSFGSAEVVQLEFMLEVPWILPEPREEAAKNA